MDTIDNTIGISEAENIEIDSKESGEEEEYKRAYFHLSDEVSKFKIEFGETHGKWSYKGAYSRLYENVSKVIDKLRLAQIIAESMCADKA